MDVCAIRKRASDQKVRRLAQLRVVSVTYIVPIVDSYVQGMIWGIARRTFGNKIRYARPWHALVEIARMRGRRITVFGSVSEPSGARPSSMIGVYISSSPSDLPHDSLRYRAAQALRKFQMRENSK